VIQVSITPAIVRPLLMILLAVGLVSAAESPSYVRKGGFVPDEKTAVRIAEAVLDPIYGEQQVAQEKPFSAALDGDTWTVQGHLPQGSNRGGVAVVELSRHDGRILRVAHGR
jgi:hypothetical protein